jgi:hypothetical protein
VRKRTIRQNVEAILTINDEARADDKVLLLEYWKHIDKIDFNNFVEEFMVKGTIAESIRRQRQLIQEEGYLLPSQEVVERRARQQMEVREAIRKNKAS